MAVLSANHMSVLCIGLCVSGGSHTQYTYMIGPGAQPRSAPEPCKYFSIRGANSIKFNPSCIKFYVVNGKFTL